jgi:hypothetical protein
MKTAHLSLALAIACLTLAWVAFAQDAPPPRTVSFTCEDKTALIVEFVPPRRGFDGEARVTHGASKWTLPRVKSGGGWRDANDSVSIWNKGGSVIFQQGGQSMTCTTGK